ncbi:MAG: DUF4139 domain-containing protein [Myxococcales bacterium]|nr:DUF4139 domain-containing protein [Myxococcales bacterium]
MKLPLRIPPAQAPISKAIIYPQGAILTRRWCWTPTKTGPQVVALPLAPDTQTKQVLAELQLSHAGGDYPLAIRDLQPFTPSSVSVASTPMVSPSPKITNRLVEQQATVARRNIARTWNLPHPPLSEWTKFFAQYEAAKTEISLQEASVSLAASTATLSSDNYVAVTFEVPSFPSISSLHLTLQYPTQLASWRPIYILRIIDKEPLLVEIDLHARLQQRTGETWKNAELRFCTSPPSTPSPPPPIGRLLLNGFPTPPHLNENTFDRVVRSSQPPQSHNEFEAQPLSLFGDGRSHQLMLHQASFTGELKHVAYFHGPQEVRKTIRGIATATLPPGLAHIRWLDTVYGPIPWPGSIQSESLEVDLGSDPLIEADHTIERGTPRASRGFNRWEHQFAWTLKLTNHYQHPVEIEIRGQLPVATSGDVEVEIHQIPRTTTVDPHTGYTLSTQAIPAGATRTLHLNCSIHAPRSVTIDAPPT